MSSSNEGMQGHIRRVRQWSDDVLVEFGKGISDLRDWHTRESEKDNNVRAGAMSVTELVHSYSIAKKLE